MRVGEWIETRHRNRSPASSDPGRSSRSTGKIFPISSLENATDKLLLDARTPAWMFGIIEGEPSVRIQILEVNVPQAQRDLYIAMRDLFFRQTRLSIDQVERLKKRVESNQVKLESIRDGQKDGSRDELTINIEKDQASITAQLNRRVYIRAW